jgi:hypothetical protein
MTGQPLPELTPEQIAAHEQRRAEYELECEIERWQAEERRQAEQRRQADQEARSRLERIRQQQRETADRMQAQQAARDAQQAAYQAQHTRELVARQEWARRQREALEQARAQFLALGPMGHPAPRPDPVLDKLIEIEEKLEPPEPTLHERLTDPRRFKFDWQP